MQTTETTEMPPSLLPHPLGRSDLIQFPRVSKCHTCRLSKPPDLSGGTALGVSQRLCSVEVPWEREPQESLGAPTGLPPQTRVEPPQFPGSRHTCLPHQHGLGVDRFCPPPALHRPLRAVHLAATPTPITREQTLLPTPHPRGPGTTRLQNSKRSQEGGKLKSGLRQDEPCEGSPSAGVPLPAAEPGRPSPSPGEVVSVRLGTPRSPARAGAVGGWVSALGLFLALHSLRKSGASALQAPARSLGARTPGPDTGAERSSGWGPRGERLGGAGEAGAPERGGGAAGGPPPPRQAAFNPRRPASSPAPRAQPPPRTPPGARGARRRRAQPLPIVVMTVMAK